MSRIPIPHGPYDLSARLSAPRRGQPAVVPVECYERERNRAVAAEKRVAALEAELEQWRDTVTNPQIQAIREDAQKVAERRHAARIAALEAENAAAREREAALAADATAILEFVASSGFWVCDDEWRCSEPDQDDDRNWCDYSAWASTLLRNNQGADLATIRREAKREALRGLPHYQVCLFDNTDPHGGVRHPEMVSYADVLDALDALDAEEAFNG